MEIMQQLNEKAMTDEETDCDDTDLNVLVKRTPPWRNNKLTKLMKRLDSRKYFKSDTVPKKERRTGHPSERSPPKDLPKWTLRNTSTSQPYSSSLSNASSPAPSQTISPESPVQFPTHHPPHRVRCFLPLARRINHVHLLLEYLAEVYYAHHCVAICASIMEM